MYSVTDETERLQSLRGYRLLDTPNEPEFDAIVRAAADALDAPIALISLIDENRQWFKARVGLDLQESPRSIAFCAHAIRGQETMVVPDATRDGRFMNNPFVVNDPSIRFYAGTPLETAEGHRLGTLCVIDSKPRDVFAEDQRQILEDLARQVMVALERRKHRLATTSDTPRSDDMIEAHDAAESPTRD
ncbi:GAF domain-containing protein [Sphingomonas sp. RT2P30]|uniref:GAF domain-containing protein n=1 Tax=Parasphingomonas halimpatiens TaxID=3096162 RepID=UPI002FC74648